MVLTTSMGEAAGRRSWTWGPTCLLGPLFCHGHAIVVFDVRTEVERSITSVRVGIMSSAKLNGSAEINQSSEIDVRGNTHEWAHPSGALGHVEKC
jgi:hypothetical protein